MTRTTCEELADRIVDYVDGELPAEEAQIVAQHLSECPRCRQMANDLKRSLGLARAIWFDNLADATAARSMGVPPMSSTAVPAVSPTGIPSTGSGQALPVDGPIHGRDAHATHGQDARATVCPHGHTTNRLRRRSLYVLAVAATILLATGSSLLLFFHPASQPPVLTFDEVQRQVARAGTAAQLLAATRIVAQCEGTESIVEQQYRYILREYADTPAAESVKAGLNVKLGGTQHD